MITVIQSEKPKYMVIKDYIRANISSGLWQKGDLIASESKLGQQFDTSRITVVRAINDLVSEGLLRREKGKGTFVKEGVIREGVLQQQGFTSRFESGGHKVTSKIVTMDVRPLPIEMRNKCHRVDFEDAIYVERLRYVNDIPMCVQHTYLHPDYFSWVYQEDLSKDSLYALAENKYGMVLGDGYQYIKVGDQPENDSELLQIASHEPTLQVITEAYNDKNVLISCDSTFYRKDRYEFEIEMTKAS